MSRTVLTIGTFDMFHPGHARLLDRCRGLAGPWGDVHVGVNSDRFVMEHKGSPPVFSEVYREEMVESCLSRAFAFLHDGDTPDWIDAIEPDFIVVGDDWTREALLARYGVTEDWIGERKIQLSFRPRPVGEPSTTELRLRAAQIELGRRGLPPLPQETT